MLRATVSTMAGVSGFAAYAPPACVELEEWCGWSGNSWPKVKGVVGNSFRLPTQQEDTYTMNATAVLRLIDNYDINPQDVGFLGLGTESSSDNSAGAVIVRGMVDMALQARGQAPLSRNCEVPEFKHACLGGVYAMKGAARYVATQKQASKKVAIVCCGDIAEYALGSTGEQTQGAGAVAMLVENDAKIFDMNIDGTASGNASRYRGPDFRKPVKRHFIKGYYADDFVVNPTKIPDFPVFSGPYSTTAYADEVAVAMEDMFSALAESNTAAPFDAASYLSERVSAFFFHRPYAMMPVQALSYVYARALARSTNPAAIQKFAAICDEACVAPEVVKSELEYLLKNSPDFFLDYIALGKEIGKEATSKQLNNVAKTIRGGAEFKALLKNKMSLGSATMANFGNLYTASLPVWLGAGFLEAANSDKVAEYTKTLGHKDSPIVMVGYGSGDAAECTELITNANTWVEASKKINIIEALESTKVVVTEEQYRGLHSGKICEDICGGARQGTFVIDRVGTRNEAAFQDIGLDYYKYVM